MNLLHQIETYIARTGIAPSKFGRMAVGDPRFVEDLRTGRRPRSKTQARVAKYLKERDLSL